MFTLKNDEGRPVAVAFKIPEKTTGGVPFVDAGKWVAIHCNNYAGEIYTAILCDVNPFINGEVEIYRDETNTLDVLCSAPFLWGLESFAAADLSGIFFNCVENADEYDGGEFVNLPM